MNLSSPALSSENRNALTSSPNRIFNPEGSPLTSKSRSNRTPLLKSSIREESKSPNLSPLKRLSTDLIPDENNWEQGLETIGKYISYVRSTFTKETDSKKDAIDRLHRDLASFKNKSQSLESTLKEKNEYIFQLENSNKEYHSNLTHLQKQLENALSLISDFQKREEEIHFVQNELNSTQATLKTTTAALSTKEIEVEKLKAQFLQLEKAKIESDSTINVLNQQYASLEKLHSSKIEALSKELELANLDNASLEQKLSIIREKANILMQDYEKNQASLQSAEEQLKKMELSSRKLTSEHETAISLIKSENLELMKELQRSLSVLEAAKSEAETATSEIAIREKKNSQLYSEIATLKDNLSQLTSQCEEAKLHSLEFKNFNETLRIKVKEFENLKNTLENDLSALKNENSSLTLELCVSKEQVETLNTQLDDSRMKCKDLENRVFHLMNDNKSLDSSYNKQISELETQRLLLESQISNFKLDNSQLHLQIHELREQKGTINEEYYSIKQKYQTLNIEHTFTLKSLTEAKNMLESLTIKQKELEEILDLNQQQLSSKQASLSRVETKYELQEKELNAIRQEKSQLELKFCATEKKVEDLQSKLQELTASDSSTKSTLQNVFSKLSSKTAELECAQTELLKLKKDLADALSNLKELESHKSEQTTTSAFYEKEISDMKSRMELEMEEHKHLVTKLQASLTTHIAIGKHLNSEKDQLDSQISLLRSKFSQLEENYDNILDQYQNQTRSHHALEQKYMSLEEQCHFIRARNSGLESKHIEHLKLLETMEQTFKKRSLNEKDEQETKLNEISKELDNLVAEKKKDETLSKEKIESLEKVKRELQEKLQRNETTLSELQSQLNNKAIQLHRFHVQSEEEKKQLELELERQTDKNKSLNQAVTSLTKKLEHFQKFSKTQSVEPLEEYETSHNADPELVRKYERLQVRYSNLEAELLELKDLTLQLDENILSKRCRALEEELSALCVEHESLLKQNRQLNAKLDAQHDLLVQNSELSMQIAMLNELNTSLMGHQNQNQKIRYLVRLKEECSRLKEQLSSTMKERDQNRFRITELEAELSALRPVEHTSGKKRPRIDFLGSLTPNKK